MRNVPDFSHIFFRKPVKTFLKLCVVIIPISKRQLQQELRCVTKVPRQDTVQRFYEALRVWPVKERGRVSVLIWRALDSVETGAIESFGPGLQCVTHINDESSYGKKRKRKKTWVNMVSKRKCVLEKMKLKTNWGHDKNVWKQIGVR